MTSPMPLLHRLDARDRALYLRWSLDHRASRLERRCWIAVTHLGSAIVTIGAVLVPLALEPWPRPVSWHAGLALAVSHGFIQVIKRLVGRERPSETVPGRSAIGNPDRFSFPSGHATSSLAIALSYAVAFPAATVPLVTLGIVVGWSRVALGVHFPGDVLVGQIIAALTVLALH
jgi:undecaprenyl-diphosphatase